MAAPEITSNSLEIFEGQVIPISTGDLDASALGATPSEILFTIIPVVSPETGASLLAGNFLLSGTPATEFSLENILSGQVSFQHNASNNAPQYTVVAAFNGDASEPSVPEVVFTPVNDGPVFSRNVLTISEGETVVFNTNPNALNLVTKDEESPSEQLTYTILSVSNGTFQRLAAGSPQNLGVGGTFTQAEVNSGLIQFQHDGSETAPKYNLRVTDAGIPSNPTPKGSSRSVTIESFVPVNDAPVLTKNSLTLTEGDVVPITSQNLAATDIEDENSTLTFTITSISGGRFELLNPTGDVVEVLASPETEPIAFTQNAVLQGLVRFVNDPATNAAPSYSVQVSDAGEPVLTDESEAAIAFTPVNDVPVLVNLALAIEEGEQVPLTADNLLVEDEESAAAGLSYEVVSVTAGRFVLIADGTTVTQFSQADIDAETVIAFEHDGTNTAPSFSLIATDEGGESITIDSGEAIQFGVFNDAPVVERATLTLTEGQTIQLANADNLLTTDEESLPSELIYTVEITNPDPDQPDSFIVDGVAQAGPIVSFTQAQVNAGQVQFVHGGSNFAPELSVTVADAPLTEGGDVNMVPVELKIEFTPTNDSPLFTVNTLTIAEGGTVVLNSGEPNLVTTDEESDAVALTYTIDSASNGVFQRVDGAGVVDLLEGSNFTQADVDNGFIQFTHDGGEVAPSYTLTVTDDGVGGDSETALSVTRELIIPEGGFIPENDAPELVNNTLTLNEGDTVVLDSDSLSATDPEDDDASLIFIITAVSNGRFERVVGDSIEVLAAPGQEFPLSFTQDEVQQGFIRFVNDPATNTPPSYAVEVSDLGDPALTDSGEAIVNFTPLNDPPVFALNTLTIEEGGTVILNSDVANPNLVTTDEESAAAALTYTIKSVSNGEFQLLGGEAPVSLAVDATFTQADVDSGLIQFVHDGGELPPNYSLTVTDNGIDGDTTTALSVTRDLTIPEGGFTNINDAPVLVNNTLTLTEGDAVFLTSDNLSATDAEDPAADLLFTITTVTNGRFERVIGDAVEVLAAPGIEFPTSFTQAEVEQGLIRFVNDPAVDEPPAYTVTVSDLGDPALTTSEEAEINFTPINDVPELVGFALTLTEGDTIAIDSSVLSVLDEESPPTDVSYIVDAVTSGRFVRLADNTDATSFTQAEIDAENVIAFEHDGSNNAPTFSLTVSDGENQLQITDESGEGITFIPTNDLPVIQVSTLTIAEGGSVVLSEVDNLNTTDEETPPEELIYTVAIANADPEQPDGFEVDGVLLTGPEVTFTQAQVNAGLVKFVQGGSNFAPNLTVTVTDTFDPEFGEPNTVEVDLQQEFDAFNDLPTVVNNTLTISEGETVTLTADNLLTTDEETPAEELTYTIDAVVNGNFQIFDLGQGVVTEILDIGGTFTQADVEAGIIQFAHNGDEAAPDYTLVVKDVPLVPEEEPNSVVTTVEIPAGGFVNVNDDPSLIANKLTIEEGGTVTFSALNLAATDPDSKLSRIEFEITNLEGGTFFLNGKALAPEATFTTAAISFGELTFKDDGDEVPPAYSVIVRDPQGGASESPAEIEFIGVNDEPVILVNEFTITEGTRLTLNDPETEVTNLLGKDDETLLDADLIYTVSNVVGGQFFDFLGNPITTFTQEELLSGDINFIPDGTDTAPAFDITLADGDDGEVTQAANVEFVQVNDPPVLVNNQLTVTEGAATLLSTENFLADDPDSAAEELTYTISDLTGGQFLLVGDATEPVDISGTFAGTLTLTEEQAAIALADGLYINLHTQNFPSGELRGQIDLEAEGETVTGELEEAQEVGTAVPDTLATGSFEATLNGTVLTISGSYSGLTSPLAPVGGEDAAGNPESAIHVHVGDAGENGPILQNLAVDEAVTGIPEGLSSFTQAQLAAGLIQFVDDGDEVAPSFNVNVSDGEFETEPVPVTITEFINTNDPPTAVDDSGEGFITDETASFTTASVLENDIDPDLEDVLTVVQLNGQDVSAGEVTLESGALVSFAGDGTFLYDPNGQFIGLGAEETATDTFEYTVSDLAGETAIATVTVEITGVNDLPVLELNRLSISQGQALVLSDLNLIATDPDNESGELLFTVADVEGGQFLLNGEETDSFTQQELLDGLVTFLQDGSDTVPTYSVVVSDGVDVTEPLIVTLDEFIPVDIGAISGGVFDLQQTLRFQNLPTVIPTSPLYDLPLFEFFDEQYYLNQNSDVKDAVSSGALPSGYQHFLQFGITEGRNPSILYDEEFYLANNAAVNQAVTDGLFDSGLQHFLLFGADELRDPSEIFSQTEYLDDNPDVLAAVSSNAVGSGFEHYILFGANELRPPQLYLYNEEFYLEANPDVATAVQNGALADGFAHFVSFGQTEGRAPSLLFNEASYLALNSDVAAAVEADAFASGFSHYVQFGRFEERPVFA